MHTKSASCARFFTGKNFKYSTQLANTNCEGRLQRLHFTLSVYITHSRNMSDLRHLGKDFLFEFIEMYKSFPCLWHVKSKQYSDRALKDKAYKVLTRKFKEVDKRADRDTIVRKVNSLRSCYRKELKKIDVAAQNGEYYKTNLWYFNNLSFLGRSHVDTEPSEQNGARDVSEDFLDRSMSPPASPNSDSSSSEAAESENNTFNLRQLHTTKGDVKRPVTYMRKCDDPIQNVLQLIGKRLASSPTDDHLDYAAKNWLATLRTVPREQQIYSVRIIGDVMCEAQLGNLKRNSRIVCEPSEQRFHGESFTQQQYSTGVANQSFNTFSIKQLSTPTVPTSGDTY